MSPISSLCSPSLMGESVSAATDTVYCETIKHPNIRNSGEQRTPLVCRSDKKNNETNGRNRLDLLRSRTKIRSRCIAPCRGRGPFLLHLPFVSCAPHHNACRTEALLSLLSLTVLVIVSFSVCFGVSSTTKLLLCGCCPVSQQFLHTCRAISSTPRLRFL